MLWWSILLNTAAVTMGHEYTWSELPLPCNIAPASRTVYHACSRGDHLRKKLLPIREKARLVELRGSSSNLAVRARWIPLGCSLLGVLHTVDVVPAHFAVWLSLYIRSLSVSHFISVCIVYAVLFHGCACVCHMMQHIAIALGALDLDMHMCVCVHVTWVIYINVFDDLCSTFVWCTTYF